MFHFSVILEPNANVYIADPIDGDVLHPDVRDWLREFTESAWKWHASLRDRRIIFLFADECDAVAFKLRWY